MASLDDTGRNDDGAEAAEATGREESPAPAADSAFSSLFSHPGSGEPEPEDEQEPQGEQEAPAAPPSGGPAAPPSGGFGLLFQAPDLSEAAPTRRRKREADPGEPEDAGEAGTTDSGDTSDTESRARRGGRRASRPQERDRDAEGDADGQRAETAEQADQDDRPGGREEDEDSGEGSGRGRRRRRRGGRGRRSRGSEDGGEGSDQEPAREQEPKRQEKGRGGDRDEADSGGEPASGKGGREDEAGTPDTESPSGQDSGQDGEEDRADQSEGGSKRRRRRRRSGEGESRRGGKAKDGPGTGSGNGNGNGNKDEVSGVKGSTRLEAKRQRRREGREAGRRRTVITEAEFLARRESVDRTMVVRGLPDRTQIGVLEDGVLVEHYVSRSTQSTMVGNVYLGRVQNVLPSMEAAFVDIGKGRNAVLYAGEVNWDAAGLDGEPKRIENALKSGESVLVQVTKDPIGHKGARLTSQVSLPGRYLVYVPGSSMTGISRKLPDTERSRLKKILKDVVPADAGVIVRTAAEGASESELRADVERLTGMWERITSKQGGANAPALLHGEPDMTVRVIRDVFNEDFSKLVVSGERAWEEVKDYVDTVAPDLSDRVERWTGTEDVFTHHRITESLAKAMDRKVWLPSGGSLVIDRTEAMTVVDVNTGKFVGSGGNLEETVTRNNIEAAEEIVRQLRLRDIGGIIVIDFIDMVLESNRDLVIRRLLECLGRDRTKHQVAEVTSLGLVQMTRKRVGSGLVEVFSEPCEHCQGRGIVVHPEPVERAEASGSGRGKRKGRGGNGGGNGNGSNQQPAPSGPTPAQIAAAAHAAAVQASAQEHQEVQQEDAPPSAAGPAAGPTAAPPEPSQPEPAPAAAAPVVTPAPAVDTEPEPMPRRARRRRGRVVAPAGPPGAAEGAPTDSTEGAPTDSTGRPPAEATEVAPTGAAEPSAPTEGDDSA